MRFVEIIEKKKQGKELTQEEIHTFITNYVAHEIPDYQVSALLMAIYFQGMSERETAYLCNEMLHSGDVIDLSSIHGVKCDKHSTGGVGDKTTLVLAPMVAACGAKIAKMSGRGLGHTGGTLDKLQSIRGFQVEMDKERFVKQINDIGLALIGQTNDLAPADKQLYALRDVTATVNSIPLIAASIMSKKLAAGSDTIVLDVKFGEGAFMETATRAEELANTMIQIGTYFGKDVRAIISNMNQPLGNAIGNALEIKEAIATLHGEGPADFTKLCIKLGSIMLMQAKLASNEEDARIKLQHVLENGKAFETFLFMVEAQGGDVKQIIQPNLLPQAQERIAIPAKKSGYVQELHALELGKLAMQLGAGRMVKNDVIDPAVGIVLNKKDGDYVNVGETLAYIYAKRALSTAWKEDFYNTFVYSDRKVIKQDLIYKVIS